MQAVGNVATQPERKRSKATGKGYLILAFEGTKLARKAAAEAANEKAASEEHLESCAHGSMIPSPLTGASSSTLFAEHIDDLWMSELYHKAVCYHCYDAICSRVQILPSICSHLAYLLEIC